jgi:hypothetical protein
MRDINVSTTNGIDNTETKLLTVSFIIFVLHFICEIIYKEYK